MSGRCRRFLLLALADGLGGIIGLQHRIGLGVPDFVVDAVEDAEKDVAPLTEVGVEAYAVLGRLNFAGVGRANRRDRICVQNTGE